MLRERQQDNLQGSGHLYERTQFRDSNLRIDKAEDNAGKKDKRISFDL